ncbi:hypothetical protein D9758_008729 [Tetrapyrgos nigripes]|uniref:Uncharacterized protein n=1 Tax=Tetrapyrgos nigripes TaxID=182062 RepID=A0A8H5D4Q9_9AGAR|nr:hypothetical protein D9758_008729 [Tetrapyrgos nigripes]
MSNGQKLKRNISTDTQAEVPIKKHKPRKPFDDVRYKTPHATLLSQSEVYKLPSSVGPHVSPSDFSPIPNKDTYRRPMRRTSSTNLKENSLRSLSPSVKTRPVTKKYGKTRRKRVSGSKSGLDSPFYSCSSSASSPKSSSDSMPSSFSKRMPSDKGSLPNIPKSASQSRLDDSLTVELSPSRSRRPSAPTLPRARNWNSQYNLNSASAVDLHAPQSSNLEQAIGSPCDDFSRFFRSPSNSSIDWARPPSRVSLFDYSGTSTYDDMDLDVDAPVSRDNFLAGMRDTSTPFKLGASTADHQFATVNPAVLTARTISDTDTDLCSSDDSDYAGKTETYNHSRSFRTLKLASRKRMKNGSGYVTPDDSDAEDDQQDSIFSANGRSAWISDSLISAPNTMEWDAPPQITKGGAYMANNRPSQQEIQDEDVEMTEQVLQDMFDSLVIGMTVIPSPPLSDSHDFFADGATASPPSPPRILRTRSVDDSASLSGRASCLQDAPVITEARRTRSGTIVAPLPRRTRSGTIVSSSNGSSSHLVTNPANSSLNLAPALPVIIRRSRSGTVTVPGPSASSSLAVVEEDRQPSVGTDSDVTNPQPGRRARAASIIASVSTLAPVGKSPGTTAAPARPRSRMRSGSLMSLGATIFGVGKRTQSGTITTHAPALAPTAENEVCVETAPNFDDEIPETAVEGPGAAPDHIEQPEHISSSRPRCQTHSHAQTELGADNDDPLNILDIPLSPFKAARLETLEHEVSPIPAHHSMRLRAKARAVAVKARSMGMGLTARRVKGGPRIRLEAAMDVDEHVVREEESDDELLLKPGDMIS